jgi:hypothetical protein
MWDENCMEMNSNYYDVNLMPPGSISKRTILSREKSASDCRRIVPIDII